VQAVCFFRQLPAGLVVFLWERLSSRDDRGWKSLPPRNLLAIAAPMAGRCWLRGVSDGPVSIPRVTSRMACAITI